VSFKHTVFSAVLVFSSIGCDAADRVWQLTRNGVVAQDAGRTTRVPLPDWTYAGPRFGCAPSLAVGPDGEAVVTSDVMPTLWRVDPRTLAVTRHELKLDADNDKDVGFFDLAWEAREGAYFAASTADGALWRIDRELKAARKVGARPGATCRHSFGEAAARQVRNRHLRASLAR
jgi:glutamine cyclotransferase